jgi:hypothetical protein
VTYTLPNDQSWKSIKAFLEAMQPVLIKLLKYELTIKFCIKANIFLECKFTNMHNEYSARSFKTANEAIYYESSISTYIDFSFNKLSQEIEDHEGKGSGWTLDEVNSVELRVNKFQPLKASSYLDLPPRIALTHAVINPRNRDHRCFMWAVLAIFAHDNHQCIENLVGFQNRYVWAINFPTQIKDINKFESANNISINVFALDEADLVYPLKVVMEEKEDHRDLLIVQLEENTHYCWIKNFNRLVSSQVTKRNGAVYICKRCFAHFNKAQRLDDHKPYCNIHKVARICMPEIKEIRNDDGTITLIKPVMEFTKVQNMHKLPFVCYADFEALLHAIHGPNNNPDVSSTRAYQMHEAMSFSVLVVTSLDPKDAGNVPLQIYTYQGKDAPRRFMEYLKQVSEMVDEVYNRNIPIDMDLDDWWDFMEATHCYLCEKEFRDEKEKRQDHCHLTGRYRGAAHNKCNLNFQEKKMLPVFFHNLSGYVTKYFT